MYTTVNSFFGFRVFLRDFVSCFKHFCSMVVFYWRLDMISSVGTSEDDVTLF